jgi:hypothetical protein
MKRLTFQLAVLLFCTQCYAQARFDPQLLILTPNEFHCDAALQKEVGIADDSLKKVAVSAVARMFGDTVKINSLPPNARIMAGNEISFIEPMDFSKEIPLISQQYLVYHFFEKFPNVLILLSKQRSTGDIDDLHRLADQEKEQYILNFPSINLYQENGIKYCKIKVQLYQRQSNTLLVDEEYKGGWSNSGFEFACEQGSISCTVNNALALALADVIAGIVLHNQALLEERRLAQKRYVYLHDSIFPHPFEETLVTSVIPHKDQDIEPDALYQCLYNSDSTKFVAFFLQTFTDKQARSPLAAKRDNHVTVLTLKNIQDPDYLDQRPHNYAYIVRGVLYQHKWYYEKTGVTYFDASDSTGGKVEYLNNLQHWDYFAAGTASPTADFWEGKLFEKIKDKRQDPNWERYKDMWAAEERENRPYIGLYEVVADELKKETDAGNVEFKKHVLDNELLPFYRRELKQKKNRFFKYEGPEKFNLIYPADRHVVLNPLKVTDENGVTRMRFFVLLPATGEIFEWKLVPPIVLKKGEFTDEPVTKAIGRFTTWDYSFVTLDDDLFWNDKVLLKENGHYKYLVKLKG